MNDQLYDVAFAKHVEDVTRGEHKYTQALELGRPPSFRTRLAVALVLAAQRIQPTLSWTIASELPRTANA